MQTPTPSRIAPIALGTALALAATTAAADTEVNLFGQAQLEVLDYRDSHDDVDADDYELTDNTAGELGVEVREDLGHGRALFARYAFRVNTATSRVDADGDSSEMVLGMEGGFGTLTGGHLPSPYAHTGGQSYDAFADTTLGAASNGGMTGNERPLLSGRVDAAHHATVRRALGYRNRGERVELWAAASRDSDDTGLDETDDRADDGEQGDTAVSLRTFGDDWELFAATTTQRRASVVDENDNTSHRRFRTHKVGGRYIGGNHVWSAQYEVFESEDRGTDPGMDNADTYTGDQEGTAWFLGYQYDFAPNVFVVQLGAQDMEYGNGDEADATYVATGFIHRISDESRLFAGYRRTSVDDDLGGDYNQRAFSVGLTHRF